MSPEDTLAWIGPKLAGLGITRLADLTGLDRVGIPVYQAVLPLSRNLSIKLGKGRTHKASAVSAAMEAIETRCAEVISLPSITATRSELSRGAEAIEFRLLAKPGNTDEKVDVPLTWVQGINLMTAQPIWAPRDCVDMDYTRYHESSFLIRTSNGLASGNTLAEALLSALYEVIERDCQADFEPIPWTDKHSFRVEKDALASSSSSDLIAKFEAADVRVSVWDFTNDLQIPAYAAVSFEVTAGESAKPVHRPQFGYGCHLNADVALSRALTETAQSRVARISGARDDFTPEDYVWSNSGNVNWLEGSRGFAQGRVDYPDLSGPTCEDDILLVLQKLKALGTTQVAAFDLTDQTGVPVVRIVCPSLGHFEPAKRDRPQT